MKQPTSAFLKLKAGLAKATKIAWRVPKAFPTTDTHELKVRGLILLAHSTFEEYLEDLSREIATNSVKRFITSGDVNLPLSALVAYHKSSLAEAFKYPSGTFSYREGMLSSVMEVLSKHEEVIDNNNGIKQSNCNKLLYPIGISGADVDPTMPAVLDGFANKRGGVAHSIQIKVTHTRSDIESDIDNILRLFKSVDKAAREAFEKKLITLH